jgi:hypothetical protein
MHKLALFQIAFDSVFVGIYGNFGKTDSCECRYSGFLQNAVCGDLSFVYIRVLKKKALRFQRKYFFSWLQSAFRWRFTGTAFFTPLKFPMFPLH